MVSFFILLKPPPNFTIMKLRQYMLGLMALCLFASCGKDDEIMKPKEINTYDSGIFVVNQGNRDVASGTISFYQRDCRQEVNNIYQKVNTTTRLGNDLQDMVVIGEKAFILSNQAKTLTVVNINDFSHFGVVEGFENPKGLLAVNANKIYVSQWGNDGLTGSIAVVDVNNLSIIKSIPSRSGPSKMIQIGPAVYLTNSGGFTVDSVITKIDATSDLVLKTIQVAPNPVDLVQDKNGAIWTLCAGILNDIQNPSNPVNVPGNLVKIENDQATLKIPLTAGTRNLVINNAKDHLYFVNNNWTYEHPINSNSISLSPFFSLSFNAYGIDPLTGYLLAANAFDFKERGEVVLFDLDTKNPVDTFEVGLVPIAFGFR